VSVTQEQVLVVLRTVQDPDLHKDIVTLGFVKDVRITGGDVDFTIELTTPACPVRDEMKAEAEQKVAALPGVEAARAKSGNSRVYAGRLSNVFKRPRACDRACLSWSSGISACLPTPQSRWAAIR